MTTVKILIDGVGDYNKGDIVKDAPPGLVHIAEAGTLNAATGEWIAVIVDDDTTGAGDELKALKAKAKELKVHNYGKMTIDELKEAIAAAEAADGGGNGAQ